MEYKRIHVRVPISGEALLSRGKEVHLKARTIDISKGGVAVTAPATTATCISKSNYDIVITTQAGQKIELTVQLVRQTDKMIGFKIFEVDDNSLEIITDLVYKYQETTDFIDQIEKYNLLEQRYVDDDGTELDVTFNVDLDKP
jgi:c-di-GMP-binding flagellar brake protein YcgR